jgi:hypothetical protein
VTDIYWYDALPLAVFGSASSTSVNLLDNVDQRLRRRRSSGKIFLPRSSRLASRHRKAPYWNGAK